MTVDSDPEVPLRIRIRLPPSGVAFAVQRGASELLEAVSRSSDALVFEFSVRVGKPSPGAAPRLLGPFTQGPPASRFVYVNAGQSAGQAESCWKRRAKVPLAGITMSMIESLSRTPGARIETEFEGIGRDGGPTCATVKGTIWRISVGD